jgi:hypothetical protein
MSFYNCGHDRSIIILDSNPLSFSAYLNWVETDGLNGTKERCWECWNKTLNYFDINDKKQAKN